MRIDFFNNIDIKINHSDIIVYTMKRLDTYRFTIKHIFISSKRNFRQCLKFYV